MKIEVDAMYLEALENVDKMVRMAMSIPNTGEFLVGAIQAIDTLRRDFDMPVPESVKPQAEPAPTPHASELAMGLIKRAMDIKQ